MLESLKVFQLVAEHASFRRAAECMGLTRPAVSHRIKQLEEHFDVQLVTRTTRRVALTSAGQMLLVHAEHVLAAADEMHAAMSQVRNAQHTRLTIGASTLPAERFLAPALVRLQPLLAEHGIEIYTQVGNSGQVLTWLEEGAIDIAVVGRDVHDMDLECRPFATDVLALIVPPKADVPNPVSLAQLQTLPLILREPGSATRQTVLNQLAQHGITAGELHIVAEMTSSDSIMAAVRAGVGCAFSSTNQVQTGEFRLRHLQGVELHRLLSLCWRKDRSFPPEIQSVLEQLFTWLSGR